MMFRGSSTEKEMVCNRFRLRWKQQPHSSSIPWSWVSLVGVDGMQCLQQVLIGECSSGAPWGREQVVPSVAEDSTVFEGLTVKDLKLIILLLAEEVFHRDRDVVLRLHPHQPGAGLELWVASRVALAEDHARGVCQKLIGWAVYWEEERDAMYMTWRQNRAGRSACPWCRSITANLVLGHLKKSPHSLSECPLRGNNFGSYANVLLEFTAGQLIEIISWFGCGCYYLDLR